MIKTILKISVLIGFIVLLIFAFTGCKSIPYLPASSDTPYGFVKGDELHRLKRYDKKTGTYVNRKDPEVVKMDFDGIAASYYLWKKRDQGVDDLISDIGE